MTSGLTSSFSGRFRATVILLCHVATASTTRPLPPWQYTMPRGGLRGVGWFGANVSGFENTTQLEMLGNYSMVIFGWQAFLTGYNYTGELDLLVEQAQQVKALHPDTTTIAYIDGLRVQPFYNVLKPIMRDPAYQDFFLRDADGYIPATTYCSQMHQPIDDPKCLCWYWNWFNESAVDFYLTHLVLPQISKPGFDGIFFDGSDGFIRGTWKKAVNVPQGKTDQDALAATVNLHKRGAELLIAHGKYPIYSEHFKDTTSDQAAWVAAQMAETGYMRFYEQFQPTSAYIEQILNETQYFTNPLPIVLHLPGASATANLTNAIAAFLVVAQDYSYFLASTGWFDESWSWHPEYNPQYGKPLGPATVRQSPNSTTYYRRYTGCNVTLVCPSSAAATVAVVRRRHSSSSFNCSLFSCTCQGFADYYGTHDGQGFGCAPPVAQSWWKEHKCHANASCQCCKGPACAHPDAAPCICPRGYNSCHGTIVMVH